MWIKIDNSDDVYQQQMNEAFAELRNTLAGSRIMTEADNKMLNWVQQKVAKLCPSPEKLKDFFTGIGTKIDRKIQGCKSDMIKNAWNNLKEMVTSQDNPEISPEEAGIGQPEGGDDDVADAAPEGQQGGEGEEDAGVGDAEGAEGEEEQQLANEGFLDALRDGWSAAKKGLSGDGGSSSPRGAAKKGGRTTTRKGTAKKVATKKVATKKVATKKGAAKKPAGGKKKGAVKKGQAKSKILQFLKQHWKQIVLLLVVCVAFYFVGVGALAMFAKSAAIKTAVSAIANPQFKLPCGMDKLPKGATAISNGVVRFADGSMLAGDTEIDTDFE